MLGTLFTSWMESAPLSLTSLIWGTSAAVTLSLCFLLRGVSEKWFIETREGDCCYSKAGICLKFGPSAIYRSLGISLLSPGTTLCSLAKKKTRGMQTSRHFCLLLICLNTTGYIWSTHVIREREAYVPFIRCAIQAVQQASFRQVKERNTLLHVFRLAGQLIDCRQRVSPGSLLTAWCPSPSFSVSESLC